MNIELEFPSRGLITPKLVKTANRTWDRNGRRVSRYHPAQMVIRLISYKIDGGEEVQIGKPSNVLAQGRPEAKGRREPDGVAGFIGGAPLSKRKLELIDKERQHVRRKLF